jgi:repressor LexA
MAACGPSGTILDGNPIDRIPLASRLIGFSIRDAFLLKAKGDSMAPKINNGDLLIVQNTSEVDEGSIIVCVNNGEALIKKIHYENDTIILQSINTKYAPFIADNDSFHIEGKVRSVISYSFT